MAEGYTIEKDSIDNLNISDPYKSAQSMFLDYLMKQAYKILKIPIVFFPEL